VWQLFSNEKSATDLKQQENKKAPTMLRLWN